MEKLKKVLGVVWKWLKSNWLLVVVIVGVSALAVQSCDQNNTYQQLFDRYNEQSLDHEKQLKDLRALQEAERVERQRLIQEYIAEMRLIEQRYVQELDRIIADRNSTQDEIIQDHNRDPGTLTGRLNDVFGIPVETIQ